ncbi:MAG: GNAT family N-acetyltransferase [Nocardioidaceae bacterium]
MRPAQAAFRRATAADAVALLDLERAASLAALGHVFPAERYPYPSDDVLARWHLVLLDPDVSVEVIDGDTGLRCVVAHDANGTLRQLAVAPDAWGRGIGRLAIAHAVAAIRARGCATPRLWCLVDNHRARRLYEHLGWQPTGAEQPAPWPPHPTEMEYVLP